MKKNIFNKKKIFTYEKIKENLKFPQMISL